MEEERRELRDVVPLGKEREEERILCRASNNEHSHSADTLSVAP
jgi:hypothetical protein